MAGSPLLFIFGYQSLIPRNAALNKLGFESHESIQLFVDDTVDRNHNVGFEWIWFLKVVGKVQKDRVCGQVRHVRAEEGNCHHKRSILHEDAGIAMVRVIVVRAMCKDNVCLPFSNEADDGPPVFKGGHKLAIVVVEDLGFDT